MDNKDKNFDDFNFSLILKNETSITSNKKIEILKIRDLIKSRYLTGKKTKPLLLTNYWSGDLTFIKNIANKIDSDLREKKSLIKQTIKTQENELKNLYNEKILSERNILQSEIIKNQQALIDNYKQKNIEFKLNLNKSKKELEEKSLSNRKFLINNDELKETISRYIVHNKKLQNSFNQLKKDYSETSFTKLEIDEMLAKIKFYQDENIRLSSEITTLQVNYDLAKNNFTQIEDEKNNIYKQIKELNNSLIKNKIIPIPLENNDIEEYSADSNALNEINNTNLTKKIESQPNNDLDDEINKIF